VTKLREGEGTYTYHENPFFQYQGQYERGVKQTQSGNASTLILRDGTRYTGEFRDGEITGQGVKSWPDGRAYEGEFTEGEMHGFGTLVYNVKQSDLRYEGNFHLNSREGQGTLTKKSGDVFRGNFVGNHPNGHTLVSFANGDSYEGEVIGGVMTGQGFLHCSNGKCFEGEFKEGNLNGAGKFFVDHATYSLEGTFTEGAPDLKANKFLLNVTSPEPEEETAAKGGGGKKDPKAKGP